MPREFVSHYDEERIKEIWNAIDSLFESGAISGKAKEILERRYRDGQTLGEIGEVFYDTRQNVQSTEKRTLEKIKGFLGLALPRKGQIKVNDGEILLAYILSKSRAKRGTLEQRANLINQLFHDGRGVRTSISLRGILYGSCYEQRRQSLRRQYFPESTPH